MNKKVLPLHTISWSKELETGIEIVDNQHRNFFMHANKFIIMSLAGKKSQASMEELEFIQDYLCYHFQTEETFQIDSHYPESEEHQAEHKRLVFQVKEMAIALAAREEDDTETLERFASFVNTWVVHHIMESDLKFSKYYKSLQ